MTNIIIIRGLDHVQVSAFSCIPEEKIVLSRDLLALISVEGRILCSFTNFITTRELFWPLVYQSGCVSYSNSEYSLETKFSYSQWALFFLHQTSLIFILLGPPAMQTGALGNTFPVLFQLKWFFIYSGQFVQNALYTWLLHRVDARYPRDYYQMASGQC